MRLVKLLAEIDQDKRTKEKAAQAKQLELPFIQSFA